MFLRRFAIAMGLLFALLGSQWPEFSQQYRQRLGGALDELTRSLDAFGADAAAQSMTPDDALKRLADNPDPLAKARAEAVREDIARKQRDSDALAAMKEAGPFARLGVMARDFDPEVAAGAYQAYEPAVPLGKEGWIVGLVGFAVGWFLTHATAWPVRRRWARRRELARA